MNHDQIDSSGDMRAILCEEGLPHLARIATPAIAPGELLVRLRACGLCGSDLAKLRSRKVGTVLGHEIVGIVERGTASGSQLAPGARVVVAHHVPCFACHYCTHGHPSMCAGFKNSNVDPCGLADFVRVPAENVQHTVFLVPAHLSDLEATFVEPMACCLRAVKRLQLRPGDCVAVIGQGSIGIQLAQLCQLQGAEVVGVEALPERQEIAAHCGIATCARNLGEAQTLVNDRTEGRGADAVIYTAGGQSVAGQALTLLRDGGTLCLFADAGTEPALMDLHAVYRRELTVQSSYGATPEDLAESLHLLTNGAVRVSPLISHTLDLNRWAEGLELALSRRAFKVLFVP